MILEEEQRSMYEAPDMDNDNDETVSNLFSRLDHSKSLRLFKIFGIYE